MPNPEVIYPEELPLEAKERAFSNGNYGRGGGGLYKDSLANIEGSTTTNDLFNDVLEDRCHHGGCFT